MKRAFALFGLLGLVGCFLPLVPGMSLFDVRELDALGVYLVIGAFAAAMVLGLSPKANALASLGAIGCFGYLVVWKFGFDVLDLVRHASIGGKAIGIGAIGGLATSVLSLAELEKR